MGHSLKSFFSPAGRNITLKQQNSGTGKNFKNLEKFIHTEIFPGKVVLRLIKLG